MASTPEEKRVELARLLRQKARKPKLAPLSFPQERLWFLEQWSAGSAAFNMAVAVRLSGQLDLDALRHSLQALVHRHEALRTTITEQDGTPLQAIAASGEVSLRVVELEGHADREREARERLGAEALRPFDLTRGPLLRSVLFRLAPRECLLLVNMHHLISDGWSLGVFVRELAVLYQAVLEGRPAPLAPLPLQYADYASWQRQWLQGEVLETQLAYWRARLDPNAVLALPTDRPRPAMLSSRGARQTVLLPLPLGQALQALGQREGTTLFVTLLAAFTLLLSRYTGQPDVVVGTLVAGRARAELEGLIGLFPNALALRTSLADSPTFRELLARAHETALAAFAHQDLPFEKLVDALKPERHLSHLPLFQVMLILQNAPLAPLAVPGLVLDVQPVDTGTTKHDLTLIAVDLPQGLRLTAEYSTDLFEAGTISRLLAHLETLLAGAVANPDARAAELPLLTFAERRQLLVEWNDSAADVALDECFHQRFEAQAERTPDAVAVTHGDASRSYGALNRDANRLAHLLAEHGAGPDTVIALLSGRGIPFLAAMLGVFKAGGAYLPLDPQHPPQRLAQVLSQSRAPLVLAADGLRPLLDAALEKLPEGPRPRVLSLEQALAAAGPDGNLPPRASPANLAYVIYTSGSTGLPKGAMVEQRGMLNHLHAKVLALGLTPRDAVAQNASQCFDISVWQFLAGLAAGGRTVIYGDELAHHPSRLLGAVEADGVTVLETVPSLLRVMLDELEAPGAVRPALSALRWLVPTGEALPPEVCRRWLLAYPGIPLVNAYGPTECSDDVTHAVLRTPPTALQTPIGTPVANLRLYVLDRHAQPCPINVPGELYVGGVGVGRGYLGEPRRTAEVFLPDPFSATAGARLYRTGDLGRFLPDGNLEFLGRVDQQVKVRGFRIELGEVEAVLTQHPAVREGAVLAREDVPGNKRLVAYAAVKSGETLDADALQRHLRDRLPEYMVPSALVVLDALPLGPNGKLDRRALPAPEAGNVRPGEAPVLPRDALEWQLAQLWEELLEVRPIGVRHNFFALGGHSLLAARLAARVQRALGRSLSLLTLFQHPTIEQLARALRRQQDGAEASSALVCLQAGEARQPPLFFVHGAGGGVLSYTELARHLGPARPVYALHAPGLDGGEPLPASVEEMARHYLGQLRGVQPRGPYLLGGWSLGGVVAFEMAQQLRAAGEAVALLALIDCRAPTGEPVPEPDPLAVLAAFGLSLGLRWEDVAVEPEQLRQLNGRAQLAWVLDQARRSSAGAIELGLDQAERSFGVFTRHLEALRRYVPHPYSGPAVLLGTGSPQSGGASATGPGWSTWIPEHLSTHEVPGDHFTLLHPPHVAVLAERLAAHLTALPRPEAE